jgi:ABC-type cobalamin transport system ATPase subunit
VRPLNETHAGIAVEGVECEPQNVRERAGVLQDTPRSNPDEKFQRTVEDRPDASVAVARQRRLADVGRLRSKARQSSLALK